MNVRIEPISHATIEAAVALVRSVFYYQPGEDDEAETNLRGALEPDRYAAAQLADGVKNYEMWVAVDDGGRVLGIVGAYQLFEDTADMVWLGWYCVDPAFRNRGIGSQLLVFAEGQARRRGAREFHLYTSDHTNEDAAQHVYEKYGFMVYETEIDPALVDATQLIYRKKAII